MKTNSVIKFDSSRGKLTILELVRELNSSKTYVLMVSMLVHVGLQMMLNIYNGYYQ